MSSSKSCAEKETVTLKKVNTNKTVKYLEIPVKSENDKKLYKSIVLSNGLKALLISDPMSNIEAVDEYDEDYAAVALLVDVGSFTDPYKYHGLAHFLENMICLGSKKYPTELAFFEQMEILLGETYAYTEGKETVYHFEISEKHLDMCIDYFADQFKEPLLLKETMIRNRDSFDTELPTNLLSYDDEKHSQLLRNFSKQNDQFNTFEKDYINDDDLHKALLDFYQRHYSAHRMYVCIQAGLPMDELESLVIKHFSDVPSNNLPGKDFSIHDYRQAFCSQFHEEVLLVKSIERIYKLELTWVLPPLKNLNSCKPESFLCYLLNRRRLWIVTINAYVTSNPICTLFKVCISLTFSGFQHMDDVLQATFTYIQLLRRTGSLRVTYEELSAIKSNNFRFAADDRSLRAFENVKEVVESFKYYSAKDILAGSQLFYDYDEGHIENVFKHLKEFNFNITITSLQKYESDIEYDKKEKCYGTEYTSIKMPKKWHNFWYNCKLFPELYLPKPNSFVSKNFLIFWLANGKPLIPVAPKMIIKSDVCEIWFRQDDKFLLPKSYMNFYFISPLLRQNPMNAVLCDLYVKLVLMHLSEQLYTATVTGLHFTFESAEKGVILKVNGYNDKLYLLVELFSKAMVSISDHITEFQLDVAKKDLKKKIFKDFSYSEVLNDNILSSIVKNIYWSTNEKYKCLYEVTLCTILDFASKFGRELYVRGLMQGNLTTDMAKNVLDSVVNIINCQKIKETNYIEDHGVELPKGSHFICCKNIKNKIHNTVVKNFYQIGCHSVRIGIILQLIMKIINEPFVQTIRGKEGLSYTHNYGISLNYDIIGYYFTVYTEETRFKASYVEERIEAFHNNILQIVQQITQEELDKFKNDLIKSKQISDKTLNDEVNRNWEEIQKEEYMFDRRNKEIEVLNNLKKQDIIGFWLKQGSNQRKLSVQVIGNEKKDEENNKYTEAMSGRTDSELEDHLLNEFDFKFIPRKGDPTTIVNINEFKENLHVYPITKTVLDQENVDDC